MRKSDKISFIAGIRKLPEDFKSKDPARIKNGLMTILCLILVAAIIGFAAYAASWFFTRSRIEDDSQRYASMYSGDLSATPTPQVTPELSPTPEPSPTPLPVPDVTLEPLETLAPEQTISPLGTANANTIVFALPTPPPVQESFAELIMHNGDTIGFLNIEDIISLPVVQKENDNDFYLTHNFDGEEAKEGALFLDGANRLVPEDECLIVYGHNMKNDTMFGRLEDYEDITFLKKHAIVRFDTIYENRSFVPFAAFTASMDANNSKYFDVRQFVFDETSYELFTLKMQSRSIYDIPVDVRYGDKLLLLVTCDYTNSSGRFILCLRELRDDESEDAMWNLVQQVKIG